MKSDITLLLAAAICVLLIGQNGVSSSIQVSHLINWPDTKLQDYATVLAHASMAGRSWRFEDFFNFEITLHGVQEQATPPNGICRVTKTASSVSPNTGEPSPKGSNKIPSGQHSWTPVCPSSGTTLRSRRALDTTNGTSSASSSSSSGGSRFEYLRGLATGKPPGAMPKAGGTRPKSVALPGVNIAGGDFGKVGDQMGTGYIYPPDKSFTYWAKQGFLLVRVPFLLERVQPKANGEFSAKDIAELDRCVKAAKISKLVIVLDCHNYGRRDGQSMTAEDLSDFWTRMAKRYDKETHVALGLMNEPAAFQPAAWRPIVEQTVKTLRKSGCKHLLMVPGGGYTGAHDWVSGGNAQAFEGFTDTNFLIEVHQYLDSDNSGTHLQEYTSGAGSTRLKDFTEWARKKGYGAFLGEFGFAMPAGEKEANALLSYMRDNADVWLAYAVWAGGSLWGDYAYSVEPTSQGDKPQIAVLKKYMDTRGNA